MGNNERTEGALQTKSVLFITGSIAAFAITTMFGWFYYVNDIYEKRHENLNVLEEKTKEKELNVSKKELELTTKENELSKRENVLRGNEHLCDNNYRMNFLLNEYKTFSGIDLGAQNNACINSDIFDKNKCIEVTEKRQKAFSLLNQMCFLAKNENKVDQSFKDFISSEKVRLNDLYNHICNDIVHIN